MIRILVQEFEGNRIKGHYESSYQFVVHKSLPDSWALKRLLKALRMISILIESKHKYYVLKEK